MKWNTFAGVLMGLVGSAVLLILLSVASDAGAQGVAVLADVSRVNAVNAVNASTPLTSTFTYQGQLKNGGIAVNGVCQMAFRLYDDATAGNVIGSPITTSVTVVNGLFSVGLNFGSSAFDASGRWLDIRVACGGGFTQLTPRQALTPAPYALAFGAPGSVSAYLITGTTPGPYPTLGFNTYGTYPYYAGAAGYGGLFQFQNGSGTLLYATGTNAAAGAEHITTPRLSIDANGNVAIGPNNYSTSYKLSVIGDNFSQPFYAVTSGGTLGLGVYNNGTVQIGALAGPSTTHACYYGPSVLLFSPCSSAAEYVPTIDDGTGFPETADLVSTAPSVKNPYSDDHAPFVVTKSDKPCDANLLGFIVKPESGADGKKLNEHYLPLAIYGYFPVKVTLENGAIKRGDPLTSSSKAGYAMKATQACKIIGYALEDAAQEGTIQVFANHGESSAPEVAKLRTQVQELKDQNAALDARLTALEKKMSGATK